MNRRQAAMNLGQSNCFIFCLYFSFVQLFVALLELRQRISGLGYTYIYIYLCTSTFASANLLDLSRFYSSCHYRPLETNLHTVFWVWMHVFLLMAGRPDRSSYLLSAPLYGSPFIYLSILLGLCSSEMQSR